MDHDDQTIGRIFTRREALRTAARAGLFVAGSSMIARVTRGATAPATQPAGLVASPLMTEGPFFVDEKLNRSDLLAGTTRPSVVDGVPLLLTFVAYRLSGQQCVPLAGAHVDVWHADAKGVYSDEDNEMNAEVTSKQTWLRGYQATNAQGLATFKTIVPGWYESRAVHVHFKLREFNAAGNATSEFTSQLFFREGDLDRIFAKAPYTGRGRRTTMNADDDIYGERLSDGTPAGSHLTLTLKPAVDGRGYAAEFPIYLTDANLHGQSARGRGGPGGPPPDGFFPW